MAGIKLSFLGPFEATLDDAPLAGLRSTKARGLLAYLASKPGFPHQRETLATLLWGEAPEEGAGSPFSTEALHLLTLLRDQPVSTGIDKERCDTAYASVASQLSPESVTSVAEQARATSLDAEVVRYRVLHPW